MTLSTDPIFEEDGEWFFWDEVWANKHGPFQSREAAKEALDRYVQEELQ